jgi:hypothetical protein
MSSKKKMLPTVVIGATKDEVDLEEGHSLKYFLELLDSSGNLVTSFKAVDDDTKAVLYVYVTNTQSNFPDSDDFLTYRFTSESWLEKDPDGNLKIPQDKEKEFQKKINRMCGDFVKRYGGNDFSLNKGGKNNPNEGLEATDMQYKIETNDTPSVPGSPGIRIDVYSTSGDKTRKPIVENKVEVHLLLNKKIRVNLEKDGLVTYTVLSKPKLKWWQIGLVGLAIFAGLLIILGVIFRKQIREWWKKRKNKKEQLEVF